jgi:NTP pyrophosphatase (non-canonical NTP hydrolase)
MKTIPTDTNLAAYQTFIKEVCDERGWDKRTALEKMLFLTEELGEVAKEVRKQAGTYGYASPPTTDDLAGELIDVLNYLLDLANMYDIDLDSAFQKNWAKNITRVWE